MLARELTAILVIKVMAILVIWYLFFSGDQSSPDLLQVLLPNK